MWVSEMSVPLQTVILRLTFTRGTAIDPYHPINPPLWKICTFIRGELIGVGVRDTRTQLGIVLPRPVFQFLCSQTLPNRFLSEINRFYVKFCVSQCRETLFNTIWEPKTIDIPRKFSKIPLSGQPNIVNLLRKTNGARARKFGNFLESSKIGSSIFSKTKNFSKNLIQQKNITCLVPVITKYEPQARPGSDFSRCTDKSV